jgi:hypothetical protein
LKINLTLLVFALFFSWSSFSQIVNIPDANFKNVLVNFNVTDSNGDGSLNADVDINNDGEIQNSEALLISNLQLPSFQNIISLAGLQSFTNLITFSAVYNNIVNVPMLSATQLTDLRLDLNNITSLNTSLLINLERLNVEQNQLNSIVIANNGALKQLNLTSNNLSNINLNNNVSLERLFLSDNPITSLDITNYANLTELYVSNSLITQLDLSNQLIIEDYDLSDVPLTSLTGTTGKVNLGRLAIRNTQLSSLDFSNSTSTGSYISITGNLQLTSINLDNTINLDLQMTNNSQLRTFRGRNNNGTGLYFNNNGLENLDFENNPIITPVRIYNEPQLDTVNLNYTNFGTLRLVDSNINNLFIKNARTDFLDFIGIININYICPDSFERNNINATLNSNNITNVNINTYCTFSPADFKSVTGETRLDMNLDNCDPSDLSVMPIKFTVVTGNDINYFYQTPSYDYQLSLPFGNHTITATPLSEGLFQPTRSFNASFSFNSSDLVQDICITPNGNQVDLSLIIDEIIPARPGFSSGYRLTSFNEGTAAIDGTVFLNYNDALTNYSGASASPVNNNPGNLSWNVPTLQPGEQYIIEVTFTINSPMDIPAVNGGDLLIYNGNISTPLGVQDVMPRNNTFEYAQTVVNSFDPNDITCLEGENLDPTDVGEYLHYKIRFENTGTASAINVVVKNEIDLFKLDINTLIPINSSHEMRTRITSGNQVDFIFENINLDFNDATNDGYLIYKIKSLPTLQLGDVINNQAEIYFDFNFPIITNTYITTVLQTASSSDYSSNIISLFPNPSNGLITITSQSNIETVQIYDHLGRIIKTAINNELSSEMDFNLSELSSGLYFIEVSSNLGKQNMKFIKE